MIKHCNVCERNVTPEKKFNWLLFIFLCGIFYIPFYILASKKCPICSSTTFSKAQPKKKNVQ
jgi:hypothetical protein